MSIKCGERASVRRGFAGGLLGISADFDDFDRKLAVSRPTFFPCDLAGLRDLPSAPPFRLPPGVTRCAHRR
jgi:hypothetical protein